jgi:hypothetical protein
MMAHRAPEDGLAALFTQHCLRRERSQASLPPGIFDRFSALLDHLNTTQERLWHNGNSGRLAQQINCYYQLARRSFGALPSPTICETGYNVGHSAIVFLSALPNARYYGFDLGQMRGPPCKTSRASSCRSLTRDSAELLNSSLFPGRVHLSYGNAAVTLPRFIDSRAAATCDIISIDGDHSDLGMQADWTSLRQLAHSGSLVFTDDIQSLLHDGRGGPSRFRPGLAVSKAVHPLFETNADLQLVGCARLAGVADEWADEGWLAAKGVLPLPPHVASHPERRHPRRPGGWRNVTRREPSTKAEELGGTSGRGGREARPGASVSTSVPLDSARGRVQLGRPVPVRPLPASGGLCVARFMVKT